MAQIMPFRGYRFDPLVDGELGKLIAPPYDVIDEPMRQALLRSSEHNTAWITKAERNEEAPSGNPYEGAGAVWARWIAEGVVRRDAQPALYLYEQHFEVHGRHFSRSAMIAAVELVKPGEGVLPHETTLAGPKADRLELMRATKTQFGLVFGLYPDPTDKVDQLLDQARKERPLAQTADRSDLLHRLWMVTDPAAIAEGQAAMRDKEILIADGHHRYETSLTFMAEHPELPAARYRMMALVNMSNPGLVILPSHRCVKNLPDFEPAAFLAALRRNFEVRTYPGDTPAACAAVTEAVRNLQEEGRHAFGLFMRDGDHRVLILRNLEALASIEGASSATRELDVTILHSLILEPLMGITPERLQTETNIEYVHDFPHNIAEASERVRSGACQALFLLNATRVAEVRAVAEKRERMPQKSTFFYPKMYSGLVFYRMDE